MEIYRESEIIELQARMPAGAMLQANEEFRERTGQLLFGVSLGPQEDYVWGRIHAEHVQTVQEAITKHGGTLRAKDGSFVDPPEIPKRNEEAESTPEFRSAA